MSKPQHVAIYATVLEKVEVFSVGRGRRKPPEPDSIRITPVVDPEGGDSPTRITEHHTVPGS